VNPKPKQYPFKMELHFDHEKNIMHRPGIKFQGKNKESKKHKYKGGGYMLRSYEMFCGKMDYGKDHYGHKIDKGHF
jgi:hypothetical protein